MKEYFIESIKIVRANCVFLFIFAALLATPTFAKTVDVISISILLVVSQIVLFFFISTVIYGHFTEIITGQQHKSFLRIFKKHWLNFFITVFVLAGCTFVLIFLLGLFFPGQRKAIPRFAGGLISILTIYVLPIVFLKQHNIGAIPLGITYLFKNFKYSLPLMLLTLFATVIAHLFSLASLHLKSGPFMAMAFNFIDGLVLYFIHFTVFVTASMVLVKEFSIMPIKSGEEIK